jgi:hypothetical protein
MGTSLRAVSVLRLSPKHDRAFSFLSGEFLANPVFAGIVPKIVEIIVASKNVFDIFRAPFDRNK